MEVYMVILGAIGLIFFFVICCLMAILISIVRGVRRK